MGKHTQENQSSPSDLMQQTTHSQLPVPGKTSDGPFINTDGAAEVTDDIDLHVNETKPHLCPRCNVVFDLSRELERHMYKQMARGDPGWGLLMELPGDK